MISKYKYIKRVKRYLKKCKHCGVPLSKKEQFHFHHLRDKRFNLSDASRYTLREIKAEIRKCILLCYYCHLAVHHPATPSNPWWEELGGR